MHEVLDTGKSIATVATGLVIAAGLGIVVLAVVLNVIKVLLL